MQTYSSTFPKRWRLLLWMSCPLLIVGPLTLHAQDMPAPATHQLEDQYCFDCHDCFSPTEENPCLKGCPRPQKRIAPIGRPSAAFPETIIMSAISDVYGPVLFAHKAHADMCEMGTGCPECHHNSPVGEYPSCRACHAPVQAALSQDIPNMTQPGLKGAYHRQCLDCHIAWSHTTGCSSCHLEKQLAEAGEDAPRYGAITYMPVAHIQANPRYTYATEFDDGPMVTFYHNNHVDSYGLECKNCHEGDSCGRCHEVGRSTMADSDLHEECQSCHQNNDCGFCHDRRERPPFDHIMTVGWDLGSYHQALRCDHCHGSTSNFQVPDAACGECHTRWNMSNFDHQVTGLNLSEDHLGSECEDCHQDATYALPPICDSCHDRDVAYPDYLPGMKVE